jgi:hypothetical protein
MKCVVACLKREVPDLEHWTLTTGVIWCQNQTRPVSALTCSISMSARCKALWKTNYEFKVNGFRELVRGASYLHVCQHLLTDCFLFYEQAQSRVLSCGYASKTRDTAPLRTQLSKDEPYAAADTNERSRI